MLRDERTVKANRWTCPKCLQDEMQPTQNPLPDLDSSIHDAAAGMKTFTSNSLRILQWNADGMKSYSDSLARRLVSLNIDVAVTEETKLSPKDVTPRIPGYISGNRLRKDRPLDMRGGDLISSSYYMKKKAAPIASNRVCHKDASYRHYYFSSS